MVAASALGIGAGQMARVDSSRIAEGGRSRTRPGAAWPQWLFGAQRDERIDGWAMDTKKGEAPKRLA